MPRSGERLLLFGASTGLRLPSEFRAELKVVQDFRPDFLALEKAGFTVAPWAEGHGFDTALLLLGRHRRENEARFAEAIERVRPGGLILAAGTKRNGAPSFRKRISELLPIEDHLSKHHGTAFWLRRPGRVEDGVLASLSAPALASSEGFETAAGGFSEGAVDPGSRLLAECLPQDISGEVADFAAGWGYLSVQVARRFPVSRVDLYDAHYSSIEAARRNLAKHAPGAGCRFFWHDLLSEPVAHRYDVIVMNPPFHRSRAAEPDIGRAMIGIAAKTLKQRGRLFLVANRGLPYEAVMQTAFARHGELRRDGTYKVLWGQQ
ncbi:class I SAM-dependent methyltransferase [Chelativorans sp.]|uniref:class I SAM-dependent methyltransferase n=1 Tax=Chelativorans sp. TaxID=2203393 RepID=UPI0028112DB7|nr:class I SAM-dependent methyltransferase [Chelativorans sp.]